MQQRINGEIAAWAELTGEANTRWRGDSSQGASFKIVRRGKFRKSSLDPDATRRAAPSTTAHRYMRSPHSATDLQYRKAKRSLDGEISRIRNDKALAAWPLITNLRATQDESDQPEPLGTRPLF